MLTVHGRGGRNSGERPGAATVGSTPSPPSLRAALALAEQQGVPDLQADSPRGAFSLAE